MKFQSLGTAQYSVGMKLDLGYGTVWNKEIQYALWTTIELVPVLYRWVHLPTVLVGSPATWQNLMRPGLEGFSLYSIAFTLVYSNTVWLQFFQIPGWN